MRKFLFLTLAILWCSIGKADTFLVTTTADGGPGSLREAITAASANGNAVSR